MGIWKKIRYQTRYQGGLPPRTYRNLDFLSKHDFCSSSMIWNNSLVRIGDRPVFFTSTGQKLVYKISKILLMMIQ